MSRQCCKVCERPLQTCICSFISTIDNETQVIVLQHPSEVNQSKGTVALLKHSLSNIHVFVGEDFTQNKALEEALQPFGDFVYLLYPSETSVNVNQISQNATEKPLTSSNVISDSTQHDGTFSLKKNNCLIILDGTWKKAYRLFMVNPFLQNIPHLKLPEGLIGQYAIRKTAKENALSSLEACAYALQIIEGNTLRYQPLFDNFKAFNDFQLSFRPSSHLTKG